MAPRPRAARPVELGSLTAAEATGVPHVDVAIAMGATSDHVDSLLDQPLLELDSLAVPQVHINQVRFAG